MKKILFAIVLCVAIFLTACNSPASTPTQETQETTATTPVKEKTFYREADIEIIEWDEPFFDYAIPQVSVAKFDEILDEIVGPNNGSELQVFCEMSGVHVVKKYDSTFYGESYCTIARTDERIHFMVFVAEGEIILSYCELNPATTVSKSEFDSIKPGDNVEIIKQIDATASYVDLGTSFGHPPTSQHYTTDGYVIYIEYDHSWNVVDIIKVAI